MAYPADLKYSKEHEWIRVDGETALIGITDFAQEQLGDVVMVELPEVGATIDKDDTCGVVESVKSVSDIFAPVGGEVVEVNEPLVDSPGVINEDCYGEGWLAKIKINDAQELDELMDAKAYEAFLAE